MHDHLAPAGSIGDVVLEEGGDLTLCAPGRGPSPPWPPDASPDLPDHPGAFDGLLVLGGPMHAGDDAGFPHFPALLELIRGFHGATKPVLGICLGAQLVARAFGGPVQRQGFVERGFLPVSLTDAARDDPLLAGLPERPTVVHWHEDRAALPPGATLLARSEACPNQIFRVGRATYGVQCHLESTAATLRPWAALWRDEVGGSDPGFLDRFQRDLALHLEDAAGLGREVARRWLGLCCKSP